MVNLLQTARYFSIIHICVVISISPTMDFFYSTITCYSSHITTHTTGPTLLCEYKLSYLSCFYYRLTDWQMKAVVIAVVVVMEVVVLFMFFLCLPLPLAFPFPCVLKNQNSMTFLESPGQNLHSVTLPGSFPGPLTDTLSDPFLILFLIPLPSL